MVNLVLEKWVERGEIVTCGRINRSNDLQSVAGAVGEVWQKCGSV